jgi:hypothetical protein
LWAPTALHGSICEPSQLLNVHFNTDPDRVLDSAIHSNSDRDPDPLSKKDTNPSGSVPATLLLTSLLPEGRIHSLLYFCVAFTGNGQISNRITYTQMYSWFNTSHNHCRFSPLIRDLHERACHHGTRKSAKPVDFDDVS